MFHNAKHKCVPIKCSILNTGRQPLSKNIVHETRAKAKRIKIVFHDTNASQLWITKHECITILNNKAKLCPNLETHFPKPCAQQSRAWLLWFQTPVTPHSFSRVSNYFCESSTLVRRPVELLQNRGEKKWNTFVSVTVNTNSFAHASALGFHIWNTIKTCKRYFCINVVLLFAANSTLVV